MLMRAVAAVTLLLASAGQAATPADRSQPVLVRLGDMALVAMQGGLPQVVNGQMVAPALPTCDLLSLDCQLSPHELTATIRYGAHKGQTQTFKLSHLNVASPTTVFAPLARFAGYTVEWDAQYKLTRVLGTQPGSNWNWHGLFDFPPPGFTPYAGPLKAMQSAPQLGQTNVQQTVTAPVGLDHFVLFSKERAGQGMQVTGSLLMGSVDVPNHFKGCEGKTVCSLSAPRDALWVLALITAK